MPEETIDSSFPLYDHLLNNINKMIETDPRFEDITMGEIRELIEGVQQMKKEALDCVFLIIRIHSLRQNQSKIFDVPYSGQKINQSLADTNNCDVKFDIREFPPILRRMLLEFVRMDKNKNN